MRPTPVARKLILNIHLLLGLIAGPIFIVLGVTGALLVFDEELDRAVSAELLVVTPFAERASLEAIVSLARHTRTDARIARVVLPQQADRSVEVRFDDGTSLFVDPYSPRVLGARRTSGHAVAMLLDLHVRLASGPAGSLVVGIAGVAVLFSAGTGLFLWWPRRVWRLGRRGSWQGTTFDLHQLVGFYASAVLGLLALSGATLYFNDATGQLVRGALSSPAPAPVPLAEPPGRDPEAGRISLDTAVRIARLTLPDAAPTFVVPGRGGQPAWVQMRFPEDPNPAGRSAVYVHPYDGRALRTLSTRERDLATAVLNSRRSVHTGEIFGWPSEALAFFASLALAVEVATGLIIWWNRRRG